MSKLNSIYFHCIIEKYDKVNDKEVTEKELMSCLCELPSLVEWSFILHDKDHTREHYHLNLMLKTAHQADSVLHSLASDLLINVNCIGIKSLNSDAFYQKQRYLIHLDNKEKYQYDLKLVKSSRYDNFYMCIDGYNPYTLDIVYLKKLCKSCENLSQVYANLGLQVSNTYRWIIKDIWSEVVNE